MNLSTYFEYERPGKKDMCIIVKGIMLAAKENAGVYYHIEHIWYDIDEKKVYFKKKRIDNNSYDSQINSLMTVLKKQCLHAGDGTYELVSRFCVCCDNREYDLCLQMADAYLKHCKNFKKEKMFWLVISILGVGIIEALYLAVVHVQYY